VVDQLGLPRDTVKQWLDAGKREFRKRARKAPPDPALDLHVMLYATVVLTLHETLDRLRADVARLKQARRNPHTR
jgi:hypothetical protein